MEPGPVAELSLTDLSPTPKWRVFDGYEQVQPGTSQGSGDTLVWSVTPGEWTVLGSEPDNAVDLTHVRAMYRLTGDDAAGLINRVCALDLSDGMFPNGAAARSLFAGVATDPGRRGRHPVLSAASLAFVQHVCARGHSGCRDGIRSRRLTLQADCEEQPDTDQPGHQEAGPVTRQETARGVGADFH